MAKRFTDNQKWNKVWFRKLTPVEKCFWGYITDNCNHAGIWEVDFETAEHYIGAGIDLQQIKQSFEKQIIEIDDGLRWFIKDFVEFQYNTTIDNLNPSNKVHASIIVILLKHNLIEKVGAKKEHTSPLQGAKDKYKEKEKEKVQDKENGKGGSPTLAEVVEYFVESGHPKEWGESFYGHYDSIGWKDGQGREIENWQSRVIFWLNNQKQFNSNGNGNGKSKETLNYGYESIK